ncbi:SCO family protein [Szabonella alba]|uniref:SCO family protein n=1 Tax=Szabonella alba TaxID=2804194 RepID=A0A8K0V6P5_9RHOB|nr:SCO family protein [Szabonella alba]MBL4916373.1 SCO family protein [Szabonella alba]
MTLLRGVALIGALAVVSAGIAGAGWVLMGDRAQQTLTPDDFGRGDYRLVTTDGQPFTQDSLQGAPSLVFFGFTHCPDVCPTTLGDIGLWQETLGDEARDLRIFMISVDPERDTPEVLAEYIGWLPGAVGVTGSEAESLKAQGAFRVFARKVPLEGDDYTMDHSSSVLAFDARGRFVTNISYQSPPEIALERVRQALR